MIESGFDLDGLFVYGAFYYAFMKPIRKIRNLESASEAEESLDRQVKQQEKAGNLKRLKFKNKRPVPVLTGIETKLV